jgi:hypothetical protein
MQSVEKEGFRRKRKAKMTRISRKKEHMIKYDESIQRDVDREREGRLLMAGEKRKGVEQRSCGENGRTMNAHGSSRRTVEVMVCPTRIFGGDLQRIVS